MLFDVYRCVQLNRWYVGVFYIGVREGRCGVFRRLCVGMILGWDFYWFGVGRGCDVFLWGGRVWKGRSLGGCYGCVVGGVSVLCWCVFVLSLLRSVVV